MIFAIELLLAFLGGILAAGIFAVAGGFTVAVTHLFASFKFKPVLEGIAQHLASIDKRLGRIEDRLAVNKSNENFSN